MATRMLTYDADDADHDDDDDGDDDGDDDDFVVFFGRILDGRWAKFDGIFQDS